MISNYGFILDEVLHKVLKKDFSTKNHEGLGLFIVEDLVRKYRGQLLTDSRDNQVVLKLLLPATQ